MMKKLFVLLLTATFAALSLSSCESNDSDDNGEDGGDDPAIEQPGLKPGTFKFTVSPMKGSWEAGDKIYVRGGTGASAETITLSASDISADGKTASAKLGAVTADSLDPDGLYAAWPDEAVQHSYGILSLRTSFIECDDLMAVAYLSGDTFRFADVCSALDFTVTGGYDGYALAAASRDGIIVTKLDVEYNSSKTKITPKQNSGYPFKYGDVAAGAKTRILFPGDMTLTGGYTLFLKKGGEWCATYSSDKELSLAAGKPVDLGDITASLAAYDGPEPRMPAMGEVTKYTVSFNELSGLCLSADEDFLWSVGDDGELAKISFEGKVLSQVHIGGDTEAISRHPETGDLLIGLEPDGVGIVRGPNFNSRVTTLFSLAKAKGYGNAGLEGLTYYKDGMVYAGTQTDSRLFLCNLETGEVIWDKALYNKQLVSEIADLYYDPLTDWLWIIDSEAKKFFAFNADATQLYGAYSVSGIANPESICVDHKHSCIWVGDDYGETSYLYKYEFTGLDDAIIVK